MHQKCPSRVFQELVQHVQSANGLINQDCLLCLHSFVKDIVSGVVLSLKFIDCRGYLPNSESGEDTTNPQSVLSVLDRLMFAACLWQCQVDLWRLRCMEQLLCI